MIPKVIQNDQTFYIGGSPHQLVSVKQPRWYSVCKIIPNPWGSGLVRVKLHVGFLPDCLDFIKQLYDQSGDYEYDKRSTYANTC